MSRRNRATQIPRPYSTCRDLMHSWKPVDASIDKRRRVIRRRMRCSRCPMQKVQILNMDGTIKANHYYPPKDYRLAGGQMTRDERAALRLLNAGVT